MAAFNLGVVHTGTGDFDAAKAAFASAIESDDPTAAPRAEVNLGILLAAAGDLPGATAAFESAASRDNPEQTAKARLNLLALRRRYAEPAPPPEPLSPDERAYRIGRLQSEAGHMLLASARNQRDPIRQLDLYVSLLDLVDQISTLAETPDETGRAVDACRGAVRIGEMLAKRFPYEPSHHSLGLGAAGRLGDLHMERGARKDARKWYARAHKGAVKLSRTMPDSAVGPLIAARSCWQLATVEPDRARIRESASWLATATEREPGHPELPFERALTLWHLGMLDPTGTAGAAAQVIADLGPLEGRLPPRAAEALTWARAHTG
jgi:tetratricopeptide (TPR) repeat protein